jgi:predicted thioesterase
MCLTSQFYKQDFRSSGDKVELIGEAVHDRFVIDEARFMAKVEERK